MADRASSHGRGNEPVFGALTKGCSSRGATEEDLTARKSRAGIAPNVTGAVDATGRGALSTITRAPDETEASDASGATTIGCAPPVTAVFCCYRGAGGKPSPLACGCAPLDEQGEQRAAAQIRGRGRFVFA